MKRRNRSRLQAFLSSPVTLVISLVALLVIARAAANIHGKAAISAEKLAEAEANVGKLEANKAKLSAEIQGLSTEEGITAELREKYHATEPGESVAVIVSSSAEAAPGAQSTTSAESGTLGWWQRFLRAIGL